jgi:hypothetical protein
MDLQRISQAPEIFCSVDNLLISASDLPAIAVYGRILPAALRQLPGFANNSKPGPGIAGKLR